MGDLRFLNLSESVDFHKAVGLFVGMRARLTKKTLEPELAQEATGEVVGIAFHPEERFGHRGSSNIRPADSHERWDRGWVRRDRLAMHVAARWAGESEDYTGLRARARGDKRGGQHRLLPREAVQPPWLKQHRPSGQPQEGRGWVKRDRLPMHVTIRWGGESKDYPAWASKVLPVATEGGRLELASTEALATINRPGAPLRKTVKLGNKQHAEVKVWRCQVPLTREDDMTFQNAQVLYDATREPNRATHFR